MHGVGSRGSPVRVTGLTEVLQQRAVTWHKVSLGRCSHAYAYLAHTQTPGSQKESKFQHKVHCAVKHREPLLALREWWETSRNPSSQIPPRAHLASTPFQGQHLRPAVFTLHVHLGG